MSEFIHICVPLELKEDFDKYGIDEEEIVKLLVELVERKKKEIEENRKKKPE